MTHDERLAWAQSATVEEWAEALATLVMGWHKKGGYWAEKDGSLRAVGWCSKPECWNPSESIADAWEIHQRMGQGELRDRYHGHLCNVTEARRHAKGQTCCYSLDLTPEDICLAALLTVEEISQ